MLRAAYDRLLVRLREDERLGDQIAGRLKRAEVERDEARAELAELRAATKGKP